jgi:hypothetical protein
MNNAPLLAALPLAALLVGCHEPAPRTNAETARPDPALAHESAKRLAPVHLELQTMPEGELVVARLSVRADAALDDARLRWTLPAGAVASGAREIALGALAVGDTQTHVLRVRLPDGEGVIAAAVEVGVPGASSARSVAERIGAAPDRGERVIELPDGRKVRAVRARGVAPQAGSAPVSPVAPGVEVQRIE